MGLIWPRTRQHEAATNEFWALFDDIAVPACTADSSEKCGLTYAKSLCAHNDECGGLTKKVGGRYRGARYTWEKPQTGYTSWIKIPSCGEAEDEELPWWHPVRHASTEWSGLLFVHGRAVHPKQ